MLEWRNKMSLFDYVKENYSCYKNCLGYYYQADLASHPEILDEVNDCDFVFVESSARPPFSTPTRPARRASASPSA